ncbi:unnamed protein product [Adineta steineri]|uniref:F-box domain-containing protein n=1 Tax=Adineta steineri TaxID=433720 RepID=A0A814NUP4_9BILA|nr:unnamed protein product [Adineta steineri]
MNRSNVHLLDLPDEILLLILKNLNNINVLYFLLDINNRRLNNLARENIFSNILKFDSIDNISIIDRFCNDILPRIRHNVKCFVFDAVFMERILLVTDYPNLTKLTICHFQQEIASNYFTNESSLRSIFQEQITNLTLINNDKNEYAASLYTENVYVPILDQLLNLKCFSLKLFHSFEQYDKTALLLRRRNRVIDGTNVQHDILDYMPQLRSFTFYICTYVDPVALPYKSSSEDIQQTLTNIGLQHVSSMVNYVTCFVNFVYGVRAACSIFSLPFEFDHLRDLGNNFPNIVFSYVTYLVIEDTIPFEHEFFMRIAQSFPLLKHLCIWNRESQQLNGLVTFSSDNYQSHSIIEYPHLTILDVTFSHIDYVEQFLNETKTLVPCLTEFKFSLVDVLTAVTKDFTREETRRNCAKVKKITSMDPMIHSEDFCLYFPSLYK